MKFSLKDLRELSKFVRSPYFNQREYVVVLFDFMREVRVNDAVSAGGSSSRLRSKTGGANAKTGAAERSSSGVEKTNKSTESTNHNNQHLKQTAFAEMFPQLVRPGGKGYNDHLMRNAMSLLMQIFEKYLAIRDFMEDEVGVQLQRGQSYRRMNLEKHYLQTIRKVEQAQEGSDYRNADYYQNEYQLEAERYQWLSNQNRMAELNLQEISDNLDLSYITQKLRQTCFSLSHQAVYPKDYDFGLLDKMLELLESGRYLETPAVAVYYYCYHALTQPEEEAHFRKFKTLLIEHASLFPVREKRDLYLLATNYCIKKMNEGERQFAREGLDIYKEALSQNALFADGRLSRFTFFNIITKALVCEEFDWTEQFINQYQEHLELKHREASASYSMARLEYERGNQTAALQLLQKADYEDLLQNLQAKALMAKIFFESQDIEVLLSHLDAMEQFIRRRKVIGYHQELFRNFIFFLRKRIETPDFETDELLLLKSGIREAKAVAERRWLMDICD